MSGLFDEDVHPRCARHGELMPCHTCAREYAMHGDRDGATYSAPRDRERLGAQMGRVFDVLADGEWHTLAGLARDAACPEASASARARDLRKEKFGGHNVERRNLGGGLWEYRLVMGEGA